VRNVSDNKLVKVAVATDFVRKSCIPVVKNDSRMSLWLDAQSVDVGTNNPLGLVTTWPGKDRRAERRHRARALPQRTPSAITLRCSSTTATAAGRTSK